jgi:hypothetical protein
MMPSEVRPFGSHLLFDIDDFNISYAHVFTFVLKKLSPKLTPILLLVDSASLSIKYFGFEEVKET